MGAVDTFAAYYNTRIRAMKCELFTAEQLDDLIERNDPAHMQETLLSSAYKADMAQALTLYSGTDALEDAVSRNTVKTFQKLVTMAQDHFRELAGIFLARWDLIAVKTLIRNRHHGLDLEAGRRALFPGPKMTIAFINKLAARETMEDLVAGLIAWNPDLCSGLPPLIAKYREANNEPAGMPAFPVNVQALEEALDRDYFVGNVCKLGLAKDANSEILRQALQMEIDRINLRALFQLRGAKSGPDETVARLLPQGTLPLGLLRSMALAPTPGKAIELLGPTLYRRMVEFLFQYLQTGRFSPLERMFERLLMAWLRRRSRAEVFTIAVLMDYVWRKHNEAMNLRMIAFGEAHHLPRGQVREKVFHA